MKVLIAALVLCATLAAAQKSDVGSSATVVCEYTPLYLWTARESNPTRTAKSNAAMLGQRFTIVSGRRASTDSRQFYELDIPVVEAGYGPNEHYWIKRDCVSVTPAPAPSASPTS